MYNTPRWSTSSVHLWILHIYIKNQLPFNSSTHRVGLLPAWFVTNLATHYIWISKVSHWLEMIIFTYLNGFFKDASNDCNTPFSKKLLFDSLSPTPVIPWRFVNLFTFCIFFHRSISSFLFPVNHTSIVKQNQEKQHKCNSEYSN